MPKNVRRFIWLWVGSALVAIVSIPIQPQEPRLQAAIGYTAYVAALIAGEFVGGLVLVPFVWLAAWRRANWARWLLGVGNLLVLPLFFAVPITFYTQHPLATACTTISAVMEYLGVLLLFVGDARPWFIRQSRVIPPS
jgi:hypothetical protein